MNRTGLVIALVVGAMTGLVFGCFPQLDLKISGLLFDPETRQFTLLYQVLLDQLSWPAHLRDASMWIVSALALLACVGLAATFALPTQRLRKGHPVNVVSLAIPALYPG